MKTAVTIAGYALGLLALFGAAFGVGALVGPASTAEKPAAVSDDDDAMTGHGTAAQGTQGDLTVSQDGHTPVRDANAVPSRAPAPVASTPGEGR